MSAKRKQYVQELQCEAQANADYCLPIQCIVKIQ